MSQLLSSLRCVSIGRPQSQFFPSKAHRRFPANSAKPGREGRSAACPRLGSPAPRQAPKPPHVSHHSSRENRDELHKGKLKQVKLGKGTETRRKEETKAVSLSTQFPRATAVRERKRCLVLGKKQNQTKQSPRRRHCEKSDNAEFTAASRCVRPLHHTHSARRQRVRTAFCLPSCPRKLSGAQQGSAPDASSDGGEFLHPHVCVSENT